MLENENDLSQSSLVGNGRGLSVPLLDPELLRAFVAIVEFGSYTHAAEALHKTQSAISLQIKRLEERLRVSLFEHPRREVVLTPQGETLLPYAQRLIQCNHEALAAVSNESIGGRIRIGSNNYHAMVVLPFLLAEFCTDYPEVRIELKTGRRNELAAGLGSSFDLVLNFQREGDFEGEVLANEKLVWIRSRKMVTRVHEPIPIALPPEGTLLRDIMLESLRDLGSSWRVIYESASVDATMAAVIAGLGISICINSRYVDQAENLEVIAVGEGFPALPEAVFTLQTSNKWISPATAKLHSFLKQRLQIKR